MFKWSTERRGPREADGGATERCPKCGATEVVGDYCTRCRVKVSQYQAYLAGLSQGAQRAWAKTRRWFVFKGSAASPPGWRSSYEDGLSRKIYRELEYPTTTARGVYLVLLAFHLNATGRLASLQLTVEPPNPDVIQSVRTAISRAQPFPLPPAKHRDQRFTLALPVSI
jgi:outer membrane biosynthesis protein TonB